MTIKKTIIAAASIFTATTHAHAQQEPDKTQRYLCVMKVEAAIDYDEKTYTWNSVRKNPDKSYMITTSKTGRQEKDKEEYKVTIKQIGNKYINYSDTCYGSVDKGNMEEGVLDSKNEGFICESLMIGVRFNPRLLHLETYSYGNFTVDKSVKNPAVDDLISDKSILDRVYGSSVSYGTCSSVD